MSDFIGCRSCDSPYCKGCNMKTLADMLHNGVFDYLMNENRAISYTPAPIVQGDKKTSTNPGIRPMTITRYAIIIEECIGQAIYGIYPTAEEAEIIKSNLESEYIHPHIQEVPFQLTSEEETTIFEAIQQDYFENEVSEAIADMFSYDESDEEDEVLIQTFRDRYNLSLPDLLHGASPVSEEKGILNEIKRIYAKYQDDNGSNLRDAIRETLKSREMDVAANTAEQETETYVHDLYSENVRKTKEKVLAHIKKAGHNSVAEYVTYKIRIYGNDRYNVEAYNDKNAVPTQTINGIGAYSLMEAWYDLLVTCEGDTYYITDERDGSILVGGAFDPDDDAIILENLGYDVEEIFKD